MDFHVFCSNLKNIYFCLFIFWVFTVSCRIFCCNTDCLVVASRPSSDLQAPEQDSFRLSCSTAYGFPNQGSNLHPLHCEAYSQPLGHQGSLWQCSNQIVYLLSFESSVFSVLVLCQIHGLQRFSSSLSCFFLPSQCLLKYRSFKFWLSAKYQYFLLWVLVLVLYIRTLCQTKITKIFSYVVFCKWYILPLDLCYTFELLFV